MPAKRTDRVSANGKKTSDQSTSARSSPLHDSPTAEPIGQDRGDAKIDTANNTAAMSSSARVVVSGNLSSRVAYDHEVDDDDVAERADADVAAGREHDRAGVMTQHVDDWHAPRGLRLAVPREHRTLGKAHANPESDGHEHRAGEERNAPCPIGERRRATPRSM